MAEVYDTLYRTIRQLSGEELQRRIVFLHACLALLTLTKGETLILACSVAQERYLFELRQR